MMREERDREIEREGDREREREISFPSSGSLFWAFQITHTAYTLCAGKKMCWFQRSCSSIHCGQILCKSAENVCWRVSQSNAIEVACVCIPHW